MRQVGSYITYPLAHLCTHAHKCALVHTHTHPHMLIHITHTCHPLYSVPPLYLPVQLLQVTTTIGQWLSIHRSGEKVHDPNTLRINRRKFHVCHGGDRTRPSLWCRAHEPLHVKTRTEAVKHIFRCRAFRLQAVAWVGWEPLGFWTRREKNIR